MDVFFTYQSPRAARYATGLFLDWLAGLPEGPLKEHVATLAKDFPGLPPEQFQLFTAWDESGPIGLGGALHANERVELVGPYVRNPQRRRGFGAWALEASCRMLAATRDVYLLAPAEDYWAIEVLSRHGFHPVDSYIRGAAGDHRAFHANQVQRTARHLADAGEPRGNGRWVVNLQNDPTTTFEFVVATLARVLDLNDELAMAYATQVHHGGCTPIRYCRTERGAHKLADRIATLARKSEFPLQATVQRR
jgi:ATP-dependent Clp protease adapter protein ClpS